MMISKFFLIEFDSVGVVSMNASRSHLDLRPVKDCENTTKRQRRRAEDFFLGKVGSLECTYFYDNLFNKLMMILMMLRGCLMKVVFEVLMCKRDGEYRMRGGRRGPYICFALLGRKDCQRMTRLAQKC